MTIYYKATRPDGTDFYTGTVDYAAHLESGTTLPEKPQAKEYLCCTPDVYHASDTPSETLIGGSWPCRLFEVTGEPAAQKEHKFGFRTLRVVREIEAWQALGPNGQQVTALIEQAGRLTPDRVKQLAAAWEADWCAVWCAAQADARDAAWVAATAYARDATREAARDAACVAAQAAARVAARNAAEGPARDAAWDAAIALVVRDLISEESFNVLFRPWQSVTGSIPE